MTQIKRTLEPFQQRFTLPTIKSETHKHFEYNTHRQGAERVCYLMLQRAIKATFCSILLLFSLQLQAQSAQPLGPVSNQIIEPDGSDNTKDVENKSLDFKEPSSIDERCGTVPHNENIKQKFGGPSIEQFEQWMKGEKKKLKNSTRTNAIITIPVVVHVIHNGQPIGGLPNISDAQIQSQIDVLNEDFRRLNPDLINTPADFIGVASDVELEFCLATVDPQGVPSSGITRYNGHQDSYSKDDLENVIKPNTIWHPDFYFNIWCVPLEGGLLGYAQFPSNSALPGFYVNGGLARTDGIVVRDYVFGRYGSTLAPFQLGRIATHEAGHFFGLRHIGGDGPCEADDFCNDTPTQFGQNGFYLSCVYDPLAPIGTPANDCDDGPGDLPDQFMNYMDYSDDACMNLFTNDQKSRIDVVMANSPRRASLANSLVCAGVPPNTTFDPYPNAPANDLCINAETIDCDELKVGNTLQASPFDIPLTCGTKPGGPGIWFKFTGDGKYANLSLCNAEYNTKINVYSGDCNNLVCVAGNDDACGSQSVVNFQAILGVEYYIYVSGFNGETGAYRLLRSCYTGLGSASNIYSSITPEQNQVYANDSLDLVAFIHRQDISIFEGSSGILRYDISTDGGMSFSNNVGILNPLDTAAARYPQLTGFRVSSSTDPFDHKLVWTAPTFSGGAWQGMVNGTADVAANSPVASTENYDFNTDPSNLGGGLCQGLPGEFWSFDISFDGVNNNDSLYIQKGTYNPLSEDVEWTMHDWIHPNHNLTFDGTVKTAGNNISFSPDGNIGWAAFLGDLVGGPDSTFSPIFIPSIDAGVTWAAPIEVNLDSIEVFDGSAGGSSTLTEILQLGNPSAIIRPTCAFEFDLTVDGQGNPHMFVVVGNATSETVPNPSYSIFSVLPMLALDIFSEDGGLTWKAYQVAPIAQLRSTIGTASPLSMDNFSQISRTPDGSHVFYSWMDSDTFATNIVPNLRIAGHRISDHFVTCPQWITLDSPLNGVGSFPTMAPEVLINETETGYHLPIVMSILNPSGSTLDPVQYVYFGNDAIIYESDYLFDYSSIDFSFCAPTPTDEFGYTFEDCDSAAFSWIDITTKSGAVQTSGLGDDNSVGPFPIGFDFRYYWEDQSHIKIGSNGWVGFDNTSNIASCFPAIPTSGGAGDNFLAPFLVDLNFGGAGNPAEAWYWSNQVDTLIVSFLNVPYYAVASPGYAGSNSFQVILSAQDNGITYQYLDVEPGFTNGACATDFQIGMENSSGNIGLQVSLETLPNELCAIQFSYPISSSYLVFNATPKWNQNSSNRVEIIDLNTSIPLQSQISNVGNQEMVDIRVTGELINNTIPASFYTTTDTILNLSSGQSILQNLNPDFIFDELGNMSFVVHLVSNEDVGLNNNFNTTELLVIDCQQDAVKLDYNTTDNIQGGLSWGGNDRDLFGGALYFNPPGSDFRLDSVELIVIQGTPEVDQTITVKVFADDGPIGMGTLLFETDLLKGEYPSGIPFSISVGGIEIDSSGFFVYWGGDDNTQLASTQEGPFSRAGYEILDGIWSEFRSNETQELHIRAYGNCLPYRDAPPNDLCFNAEFINCLDSLNGNTSEASPYDTPGVCGTNPTGSGIWYRFIGDGNNATLSLSNVLFNAEMNVYSGSCEALTCVDGTVNNIGQTSSLNFMATEGTDYYIYISGSLGDTGTFTLTRAGSCTLCPLSIATEAESNSPICENGELFLYVQPDGQFPFTYNWSGPGGTFFDDDTGFPFVLGATSGVYSVTVTNSCGSAATISTNVIVNTLPEIIVSGPLNLSTDPGLCTATTNASQLFSLVTASGIPTPNISIPYDPQYPLGMNSVIVEASNVCGTSQAAIDIIVTDNLPPTAICKTVSVEVGGEQLITGADIDNGSFDPCGVQSLLVNGEVSILLDTIQEGINNIITLTVSDGQGNQSSCEATVFGLKDLCINGDDLVDSDYGGLPDDCDCSPFDNTNDKIKLEKDVNIGIDFDGVNDYLSIPDAPLFNPSDNASITFEAWIKPDLTSVTNTILFKRGNDVGGASISIEIDNGVLYMWLGNNFFSTNTTFTTDVWTHVAASFNHINKTLSIYHDGQLVKSGLVNTGQLSNEVHPLHIGIGYFPSTDQFKGQMDEVRFWSGSRTEVQIQGLMAKELTGGEPDLLAYFNFNNGLPGEDNTGLAIAKDHSPNGHDATLSGFTKNGATSNWINDTLPLSVVNSDTLGLCLFCPDSLKIAMDFDGIDDYISIPNSPLLVPYIGNAMTFEAWIKPDDVIGLQTIANSSTSINSYNFQFYLDDDLIVASPRGSSAKLYSFAQIQADVWTHIAFVFAPDLNQQNNSTLTLYINGQLDNQIFNTGEFSNLGNPIILGNNLAEDRFYDGHMDEVRFWSESRSASQIANHMGCQLYGGEENLVAYYNFSNGLPDGDNTNLTTVPDVSNFDHDGTLFGFSKMGTTSNWVSDTLSLSPPKNAAMDFDGVNDYISVLNHPDLIPTASNAVTMEAWIYPDSNTTNELGHISASGDFPNRNHQIYFYNSTNKIIVDGLTANAMVSNSDVPNNEWTHIAVTFNLNETKLYINGELDNTRIGNLTANNLGFDLTIGSQESGTPSEWNWKGKMDDVRFWDHARSEQEIQKDMRYEVSGNESGLAAYYNFNNGLPEGDNSTLLTIADVSGNGNTGTIYGFAKTGSTSNWVSSPFRFSDSDDDGLQDFCDNCLLPKTLLLENMGIATNAVFRAVDVIILGENLTFLPFSFVEFKAKKVIISDSFSAPGGLPVQWTSGIFTISPYGCEE
jgi:hypothetical protein